MKKLFPRVIFVFFILFLSLTISAFIRSYCLNVEYKLAVFEIFNYSMLEFWRFISNPVIFLFLITIIIIWQKWEYILVFLSFINELSIGSVTAKFDFRKYFSDLPNNSLINNLFTNSSKKELNDQEKDIHKIAPQGIDLKILESLTVEYCKFLLNLNNKALTLLEIAEISRKYGFSTDYLSLMREKELPPTITRIFDSIQPAIDYTYFEGFFEVLVFLNEIIFKFTFNESDSDEHTKLKIVIFDNWLPFIQEKAERENH